MCVCVRAYTFTLSNTDRDHFTFVFLVVALFVFAAVAYSRSPIRRMISRSPRVLHWYESIPDKHAHRRTNSAVFPIGPFYWPHMVLWGFSGGGMGTGHWVPQCVLVKAPSLFQVIVPHTATGAMTTFCSYDLANAPISFITIRLEHKRVPGYFHIHGYYFPSNFTPSCPEGTAPQFLQLPAVSPWNIWSHACLCLTCATPGTVKGTQWDVKDRK